MICLNFAIINQSHDIPKFFVFFLDLIIVTLVYAYSYSPTRNHRHYHDISIINIHKPE